MTKIISWNVNGLGSIIKNGFFDFIENEQPDIICLQETKLNEEPVAKPRACYRQVSSSTDRLPLEKITIPTVVL